MSITNMTFIFCFLPIALAMYYFLSSRVKEIVLIIISLLFYAIGSIEYLVLFSFAVFITVLIGRLIHRCRDGIIGKILLVCGIAFNVGLLAYYKYTNFAISIYGDIVSKEVQLKDIALPLGISFFTFKSISYLVDTYKNKNMLSDNPIHDALYLSFFAQIQSGPLSRYENMALSEKKFDFELFSNGVYRFLMGFSKKVLIANVLANITKEVFNAPFENYSTAYSWLGAICFSLQLFFDFSGYSDMAIGITEMFGYKCPENFNYPYITNSVTKFWRRWHITLSEWFRDYIYIPLGGARNQNKWRVYFNLFVVWLLTGIWHGAAWNFIAWGLGYFVVISFERLVHFPERLKTGVGKTIYRVLTLLFINFQWVIFNSKDLASGLEFIKKMVAPCTNELADMRTLFLLKDYGFYIIIAIILCIPVIPWIGGRLKHRKTLYTVYEVVLAMIVVGAFVWSISFVVAGQNNPFAYANF